MDALYTKFGPESITRHLFHYFAAFFSSATHPMKNLLCGLMLAMLAMESLPSLRSLHRHFSTSLMPQSLNCYYRACKAESVDDQAIFKRSIRQALKAIPERCRNEILFLSIDDTIIAKEGRHFECIAKLHDHAMHTGKLYVYGHCFVSLMLSVPVFVQKPGFRPLIRYVHVPVAYTMWTGESTKLEIAANLVDKAMEELAGRHVVLMCDSWYPKKELLASVLSHDNLDVICNVRVDTAMFDLPPEHTGKRGRPAKRGNKVTLDDFDCTYAYGKFKIGHRRVMTRIFGNCPVHAYVSVSESGSRRLFMCTAAPAGLQMNFNCQEDDVLLKAGLKDKEYLPIKLYRLRWHIEVSYYEQKMFWSLEKYMVRSKRGIERLLNLICVVHATMRLLPYIGSRFAGFRELSPQELRLKLSWHIQNEIFLSSLAQRVQNVVNSSSIMELLHSLGRECCMAA